MIYSQALIFATVSCVFTVIPPQKREQFAHYPTALIESQNVRQLFRDHVYMQPRQQFDSSRTAKCPNDGDFRANTLKTQTPRSSKQLSGCEASVSATCRQSQSVRGGESQMS